MITYIYRLAWSYTVLLMISISYIRRVQEVMLFLYTEHPCDNNPCAPHGVCRHTLGSPYYTCNCDPGWYGHHTHSCNRNYLTNLSSLFCNHFVRPNWHFLKSFVEFRFIPRNVFICSSLPKIHNCIHH